MIRKNIYILDMFPYPSGEGLHVGHPKGYIATDIYSRFKKMNGYDVVHPMGWDAFGLPAEQFALKNKSHPKVQTEKNVSNFKKQLEKINLDYDWDREISTTDPKFYKWTQWIFKQLYKKGLAYESFEPINWCPSCKTGLANEDLEGNACERCSTIVEKKPLRQWNLAITKYADRLIDDLATLTLWPEHIKTAQKNWIGRSEGSEIEFRVIGGGKNIEFEKHDIDGLVGYGTGVNMNANYSYESKFKIFTTRADTLFGCTYTVLAPEHKLVREFLDKNIILNKSEVEKYLEEVKSKTDIERSAEGREKTGVRLEGVMAINPANNVEVPIYIADYVLASYGTGAIMAVPAHDERDYEFAIKYNIISLDVVNESNVLINSGEFDGMTSEEARRVITAKVGGKLVTKYKLREWVFARQRYWGEPFPIVFDENHKSFVVADSELPILLPEVESYEPTGTGESPLADIKSFTDVYGYINGEGEFVSVKDQDSKVEGKVVKLFKRETNTMPQWAGSSWYYLRFLDPDNNAALIDPSIERSYRGLNEGGSEGGTVDLYVGGDHATRHLIYARFWHKFLYDIGIVTTLEPFKRLEFLGFILAEDGRKMSKRWGNIINPDDIVAEYGSDTLRVYEMFMAPFETTAVWNTSSIRGVKRFLERVSKLVPSTACTNQSIIHQNIKKVTNDIENFKFNTCVSQLMICLNEFESNGCSKEEYDKFMAILFPFAPTLCNAYKDHKWPEWDENKLQSDTVKIALQINGKMRGTFDIALDASDEDIKSHIKTLDIYNKYVVGESDKEVEPKKIIIVKNKIVNVVV
jgi:leucyl-tRNA synthetase